MKKGLSTGVKSIIVLTVICLVVAGLLAVTNHFTEPVIKETRAQKIAESLKKVLPDSGSYNEVELNGEDWPKTVKNVYSFEDGSYAVVLATTSSYSNGDMGITVGILPDGTINNIEITSYMESKDIRDKNAKPAPYPAPFVGKNAETVGDIETVSGATYSSKAFKKALADAFTAVELAKQGGAE